MKKTTLALAGVTLGLFMATSSFAASTWDTCSIMEIGVAGDSTQLVRVTGCETAGNNRKYLGISRQQDTTMAVALTALSLGKSVKIYADFARANTSSVAANIETMYLAD
ncbi:MAG: hypothetical protein JKY62_14130 [Desulfocapsa sp.]|nr:hypothetical protein [Desulfocapsa sp.]